MRNIIEILRLHHGGDRSHREIARAVDVSRTTVGEILRRAKLAGMTYPLPIGLDEAALEALLFPPTPPSRHVRPLPDWAVVHRELGRKGVTLDLLWQEYKEIHPDGYLYSGFCDHYRQWVGKLSVTMRQTHAPGDKLFVDYAGNTVSVVNGNTGEIREASIFVAAMGASNYTYCEATWSQSLPDWIGSHVRTLEHLGGSPAALVPDNLKSGVTKACFYDPDLNHTYRDMATHYSAVVLPARPRRPTDKPKVEGAVLLAQRWILARLRDQRFFSLDELNRSIRELLTRLNTRPFKKLPGCRQSAFDAIDRPALRALPAMRYEFAEWKTARVGIDYHVDGDGHYYSVPHRFAREKVDVRMTASIVEVFHRGTRIASHARNMFKGHHSTIDGHMTPGHLEVKGWNATRLVDWAARIGPHTKAVVESILHQRRHPQQGYRACLGILRMGKAFGDDRLEAACDRAITVGALSYRSLKSILAHGLDRKQVTAPDQACLPLEHANVRGPNYYH
jgi:transposase